MVVEVKLQIWNTTAAAVAEVTLVFGILAVFAILAGAGRRSVEFRARQG